MAARWFSDISGNECVTSHSFCVPVPSNGFSTLAPVLTVQPQEEQQGMWELASFLFLSTWCSLDSCTINMKYIELLRLLSFLPGVSSSLVTTYWMDRSNYLNMCEKSTNCIRERRNKQKGKAGEQNKFKKKEHNNEKDGKKMKLKKKRTKPFT